MIGKKTIKSALRIVKLAGYSLRTGLPLAPYGRIASKDRDLFQPILDVWKPANDLPVSCVRWFMSEWCNYGCEYCDQTHGRYEKKSGSMTAHAFDNFPVEKWIDAFQRHFEKRRQALTVTGGEPMIDVKNMLRILNFLSAMRTVDSIRIDTNGSWKPSHYRELERSKLILNCSFHPSQTSHEDFLARIRRLQEAEFKIGIINYVMSNDHFEDYWRYRPKFDELGVVLNPSPEFADRKSYSQKRRELLQIELPRPDHDYKVDLVSPKGQLCLYPAIAYEMSYTGWISVGCVPNAGGSFFSKYLPTYAVGPVPCPYNSCNCLDKYSFLAQVNRNTSTNPLEVYSNILRERRKEKSGEIVEAEEA